MSSKSGSNRRCPVCSRHMADYLGDNMCEKCVQEKGLRRCERCSGRLSRWNRGKFCNPCWTSMDREQREEIADRRGYSLEAYNPKKDLMREVRLDEIAREPIEIAEAKRSRKNAQRKVNLRKQKERRLRARDRPPYSVDSVDEDA